MKTLLYSKTKSSSNNKTTTSPKNHPLKINSHFKNLSLPTPSPKPSPKP
jgi:hypothetical protein